MFDSVKTSGGSSASAAMLTPSVVEPVGTNDHRSVYWSVSHRVVSMMGGATVQRQMCNLHALTVDICSCRYVIDPRHLSSRVRPLLSAHRNSPQPPTQAISCQRAAAVPAPYDKPY